VEFRTGNSPPVITSNGGGATASVSPAENQTFVTDVDATDPDLDTLTYSISGGADQAVFAIDPGTGVLGFISAPDSEAPSDTGGNNVYDVVVSVSDDDGAVDSQPIAATVLNLNESSPVITSDGGGERDLSRPDGQTLVTDVNATDGDGQPLTYSISGGDDQSAFTIDPVTGLLAFVAAPDFDAPTDVGADNVYEAIVSASDDSLSDSQAIAVTVVQNAGSRSTSRSSTWRRSAG
jgi:serralysin